MRVRAEGPANTVHTVRAVQAPENSGSVADGKSDGNGCIIDMLSARKSLPGMALDGMDGMDSISGNRFFEEYEA